ncbi:hypothetical protein VBD025_16505 [Virgibacillus flavescens]|uniref:hypothetical protein n=1 Tax=Virgibacillus flavescens TaxID=1611422 RepID=UPI003D348E2E
MKKSILTICILLLLCSGCSTKKEKAVEKLKPTDEYDFNIVVFLDEEAPEQITEFVKEDITDEKSIWRTNPNSISTEFIKEDNPHEYESIFDITKYPAMLIFNKEELAFQTTNIKKMKRFFATQLTFTGKSKHWSVTYNSYLYSKTSELSEYTIQYIGDAPTPKYVDYQIGSTSVNNRTNTSVDKFPMTRPGGGCSECAVTSKDDQIKATIEWDGKSESFTLTSK